LESLFDTYLDFIKIGCEFSKMSVTLPLSKQKVKIIIWPTHGELPNVTPKVIKFSGHQNDRRRHLLAKK
jgi:hypothetical protein